MGAIDCLANVQMIQLYGDAVSPFLQVRSHIEHTCMCIFRSLNLLPVLLKAMHFCYGFGAFVSPLIAEPFLLNQDCSPFIDHENATDKDTLEFEQDLPPDTNFLHEAQSETQVRYAFFIMAALQVPIPFLVASLIYREKILGFKLNWQDDESAHDSVNGGQPKPQYGTIHKKQGEPAKSKPMTSAMTLDFLVVGDINKNREQDKYVGARSYKIFNRWTLTSLDVLTFVIVACTALLLFIFDGLQVSVTSSPMFEIL